MATEQDIDDFSFGVDDCIRWITRLEKLTGKFLENNDVDNARLMHICSNLMQKLAYDVECQTTGSPFPVKGGDC